MARRILLTADAPQLPARKPRGKLQVLDITVLMGDPRLPDQVKRNGAFNPEDMDTVRRLKDALSELPQYRVRYLDNHKTLERDLAELRTDLVLNLCDEGYNNDPFKELHVPAMLDVLGLPYTGAGPAALAACYDKGIVRAVAQSLDVPVPLETYVRPGRPGRDAAVGFPRAAQAQPGRQLAGHHQGCGGPQHQGPARLPRQAAGRFPAPRDPGAGIPDRRRVLRVADRQSGSGPAGRCRSWRSTTPSSIRSCRRSSATSRSGSRRAPTGLRSAITRRACPITSRASSSSTRRGCSSG